MSHTPGPWRVDASEDDFGFHNYTINGRGDRDHREANAQLISAAPDLLAALLECVEVLTYSNRDIPEDAIAAIAKATATEEI